MARKLFNGPNFPAAGLDERIRALWQPRPGSFKGDNLLEECILISIHVGCKLRDAHVLAITDGDNSLTKRLLYGKCNKLDVMNVCHKPPKPENMPEAIVVIYPNHTKLDVVEYLMNNDKYQWGCHVIIAYQGNPGPVLMGRIAALADKAVKLKLHTLYAPRV